MLQTSRNWELSLFIFVSDLSRNVVTLTKLRYKSYTSCRLAQNHSVQSVKVTAQWHIFRDGAWPSTVGIALESLLSLLLEWVLPTSGIHKLTVRMYKSLTSVNNDRWVSLNHQQVKMLSSGLIQFDFPQFLESGWWVWQAACEDTIK